MLTTRRSARLTAFSLASLAAAVGLAATAGARGDTVWLKNGIAYRGTVDRDKPLLYIYDGLKRVVLRDSKVDKIETDASFANLEGFTIEQPLVVHGGAMPKEVISVEASPWNDRGRRTFVYEGSRIGKKIKMEQAINQLGPYMVKLRGVDGFWQGQLATGQVPREVVLGILAKVDQTDKNERVRVARFLIQAEWYAEARAELDRILADFPDDPGLRERVAAARTSVAQLEAAQVRAAYDRARAARQFRQASALLRGFPTKDVAAEQLAQARELERAEAAQSAADKALADDLRATADRLPAEARKTWEKPLLEVLKALAEAPEAVRDRFAAWQKARSETVEPAEALFSLAMSGFVAGSDAAVKDLETATTFWSMRDSLRTYLASHDQRSRDEPLAKLEAANLPADEAWPVAVKKLDTVTRLARHMTPPLHDEETVKSAQEKGPRLHRVRDDENAEPTEYLVSLPPEYHPLRSYPAVVALHDGNGPEAAISWWSAEAAKRGYVVIAPEFRLAAQDKEYQFSVSEHAAVELALRDARRRYSIDSDRVFLGGQLMGANMAWDFGLAHPDLFAGVAVINGLPFKYVNRYLPNGERLPFYVALGDLAPAANEVVFGRVLKPLILRSWDVTYVEYMKRGLEGLPEEAPNVFDWMDKRPSRDPYPKAFDMVTARTCDNRFFGVVVREFAQGRATAPAAVTPFGENLTPATIKVTSSSASNLVTVQANGLSRFDVWVSPKLVDFRKRLEVRINGDRHRGLAKPELEPMLEDLRLRGDTKQIYWMKVPSR
jgi:predicted esterase